MANYDLTNIGLAPNDDRGDPLRIAYDKINKNWPKIPHKTVAALADRIALVVGTDVFDHDVVMEADTGDLYILKAGIWEMYIPHHQNIGTLLSLNYDPARTWGDRVHWEDLRGRLDSVNAESDLTDRSILPWSHMRPGKLVIVRSTGKLYELLNSEVTTTGTMTDWRLVSGAGGVEYVGRMLNLPDPKTGDRPADGSMYVIEMDFEGKPYHRLLSWDESILGAYTTVNVPVKAHIPATDVIADLAELSTLFSNPSAMGMVDAGRYWTVEVAAGLTSAGGDPYAGHFLPLGTKVIWLGSTDRGVNGWIISPADAGYVDAATTPPVTPADVIVDDRSLPRVAGGWRWLNRMNWVHALNATPDHSIDNRIGDFQSTTERDMHVLKVYNGSAWVTLFSEDEIKGWIASLALFRGTVSEDNTAHIGTVPLTDLPDLSALSTALDKTFVGRYWIWQGAAPYAVTVAGTHEIGDDLDGADIQVGDWLVVADRGNGIAGDALEVDLHWVRVGGDLLTASRGHSLFGLHTWVDGAYERGSLVNRDGNIWRSTQAVVAGDGRPGDAGTAVVATPVVGETVNIVHALAPEISDDASMKDVLVTRPKPPQWVAYPTSATFDPTVASGTNWVGSHITQGGSFTWTGFPGLTHTDTTSGLEIKDGWMFSRLGITGLPVDADMLAAIAPLAAANKWELVPVGGGVKWVPTDADLPPTGRIGDSYLIVTSASFSAGDPAIVTWDSAQNKWVPVGGADKGTTMALDGGDLIYPKTFVQNAGEGEPTGFGKRPGDLLVSQDVANGKYHLNKVTQQVGNNVVLSMPRGLVGFNAATGRRAIGSHSVKYGYLVINFTMEKRRRYKITYDMVVGVGVHPYGYYVYNQLMVGSNNVLANKLAFSGQNVADHQPIGNMRGTVIYDNPNVGGNIQVELLMSGSSGDPQAFGGQMTIEDVGAM